VVVPIVDCRCTLLLVMMTIMMTTTIETLCNVRLFHCIGLHVHLGLLLLLLALIATVVSASVSVSSFWTLFAIPVVESQCHL